MKTTFDPKKDRLSYGDLLSPESGFELRKAVCTTYSLDLQTLVASTIALGLGEATDSELAKNPINLLSALQKVTDKMIVFCDASQIHSVNEKKRNRFLGLLEKTIVPIALNDKNNSNIYPSFHPKCWILQYVNLSNRKKLKYKLLVMSRNLTFDRSWDVTIQLDGHPMNGETDAQTRRLIDFVNFLKQQSNDYAAAFLDELVADLKYVKFETSDNYFYDFEFLPIGIGTFDIKKDHLFDTDTVQSITVMSPFISKSVIQKLMTNRFAPYSQQLITREAELYKIKDLPRNFTVFCLQDEIIDGENNISDSGITDNKTEDIHAKIYVTKDYNDICNLYLGSMNASENAINRNVELLVKLTSKSFTPYVFLCELGVYRKNFKQIDFDSLDLVPIEQPLQKGEDAIKRICRMDISAQIIDGGNGNFDIEITIPDYQECETQTTISPFFAKGICIPLASNITIKNLKINQLSEFYTLHVEYDGNVMERTIKIPTDGMPEERDKSIVTSIISNKKKLSEYIAFILGDDTLLSFAEDIAEIIDGDTEPETYNPNNDGDDELMPIYERMLKTSVTNPDRIKEIESVIQTIDDEKIVTPEFKKMYQTFKTTLKL